MPVYNASHYLKAAMQSVLAQSFKDFEFIIVDDGSSDNSLEILREFAKDDSRIKLQTRPNTGIVGALSDGLAQANGEFVARMDADDVALPNRLETQIAALRSRSECVAMGTAVVFTDPEGRELKVYRPSSIHSEIENELAAGNGGALVHPSVMFRRDALLRCGGYREQYNFIEDLDLYVRLLEFGALSNLRDVMLHYRQHGRSVNHTKGNRADQVAEIIAPLRERMGLPSVTRNTLRDGSSKVAGGGTCRRLWALAAVEGKNYKTARINALLAIIESPLERLNWSCLRYVLGVSRHGQLRSAAV